MTANILTKSAEPRSDFDNVTDSDFSFSSVITEWVQSLSISMVGHQSQNPGHQIQSRDNLHKVCRHPWIRNTETAEPQHIAVHSVWKDPPPLQILRWSWWWTASNKFALGKSNFLTLKDRNCSGLMRLAWLRRPNCAWLMYLAWLRLITRQFLVNETSVIKRQIVFG